MHCGCAGVVQRAVDAFRSRKGRFSQDATVGERERRLVSRNAQKEALST